METHYYLKYLQLDQTDLLRNLTIDILNFYFTDTPILSSKTWKEKGNFTRSYKLSTSEEVFVSKKIGYDIIHNELLQNNFFEPRKFDLYPLECIWLDHSLRITRLIKTKEQPFVEIATEHIYGTLNPVSIRLYTNGIAATSMMNYLFRHVVKQREKLINLSSEILNLDWYLDLRNLICDSVSLVDMTFNRLHFEAQNNPKSWWNVSADIGARSGVRLIEKIKWIHRCTGKTLPCLTNEKAALVRLKNFRNQLMHFDPPYLIFQFDDLANYFNDIIEIGTLIYKIRKTIGAEISKDLVEFMLQKKVGFIEKNEVTLGVTL